jgi:hypothetical protein
MNTIDNALSGQDQMNPPPAEAVPAPEAAPHNLKAKSGFGGCLLYPLLFLAAQPVLFVYMLATSFKSPLPNVTYRIFWPYTIYDLALLAAVITVLWLFVKKKAVAPAMFVLFLAVFAILSGLLVNVFWRLPEARVTGRDPLSSHLAMLFNCLLLMPYFARDDRVKNTFIHAPAGDALVDQLIRPVAPVAERLYGWLARSGKRVFVYAFAFVILVFLIDWAVDSIVLYRFLR